MASADKLRELLHEFSAQQFETEIEFMAVGLPQLAEHLGYARGDLRFEYAVGDVGDRLRADGVLFKDGIPRVVIETWMERGRFRQEWVNRAAWLNRYMEAAQVEIGILLSPRRLTVRTSSGQEQTILLADITLADAESILSTIGAAPAASTQPIKAPIAEMIDAVIAAETNDEKKKSLELLAAYIIADCPSLSIKFANLRTRSSEIDLVCECLEREPKTPLHSLGRYFLVECKNWRKPAGAAVLRDFVGKLQKTRCALGVLFSREGVTGEASGADAMREIHSVYDRETIAVLVVSLPELDGLTSGRELIELLDEKLDALRFDL